MIPALSSMMVTTKYKGLTSETAQPIATINAPQHPTISGMPAWVTLDNYKNCKLIIDNCAPYNILLPRNEILGVLDFESEQCLPLNEGTVASIISNIEQKFPKVTKKHFSHAEIEQKANLNGPDELKQRYNHSHIDKYSMKEITECIGDIGHANSTIFSTLDLTSGFWQMQLEEDSQPLTSLKIPGKGQYQWVTSPMGLLGCPASFQRLMETVLRNISNVLVNIDVLLHTATHKEHLQVLEKVFERLHQNHLKVNLDKCVFGNREVSYLGFMLTPEGIKPGRNKLQAIRDAQPPTNIKMVRSFVGLCNFFRTHIKDFAIIAAPLFKVTRKDSGYKSGPLPPDALHAFKAPTRANI
jgi:hypothetical protein